MAQLSGSKRKATTNKFQMHRQSDFGLQDDPIMLRPRVTSTNDHPPSDHVEFLMPNHGNTSLTSRTQVGRRVYNECVDTALTSGMIAHYHQRHGNTHTASIDKAGFSRKNTTDNQLNTRDREDHRVENECLTGRFEPEEEEGGETETEIMVKQTRGPTYMQNIWGRAPNLPLLHVDYNEFGQPIAGEHSKLCHFLGSIARNGKYCPLDVKDWHAMPKTKKTEMLDVVKLRFHVPAIAEKWILTSIGHKWRNWRHFLKTKYWADVPVEHLVEERDERVLIDQWIKLLTHWKTEESKKSSERNKIAREKKTMNQRTGKTSFAQVRDRLTKEKGRCPTRVELFKTCFVSSTENSSDAILSKYSEMQEFSHDLPEGSEDAIGPNDLSQIMGKDATGNVRMFGQGISPTEVWTDSSGDTTRRLMEHRAKIAQLEATLLTQQRSSASQVGTHQTSTFNSLSPHAMNTTHLQVGAYVFLKSLFNPTKIVAKGCVHSTDPTTKVGGQVLGLNWCEINVQVIGEPDEQLIRPYGNLQKLSQTLGEMIAWPCYLVTPTQD